MSDEKMISVVVPIYNMENYLTRCVDSILAQTYGNLEILLIDDGSTDQSSKICDKYGEQDNRVKVFHKANGGLSSAKNAGIKFSTGEYLAFVDADDYVADSFIEELIGLCLKYDAEIAQCAYYSVADEVEALKPVGSRTPVVLESTDALKGCCDYRTSVDWINSVVTWNKLYKKSLFSEISFPEGRIHEDEYVTYRLKYLANRTVITNRALYYYYRRSDSISGSAVSLKTLDKIDAFREKELFLKKIGLEKEYRDTVIVHYRQGSGLYQRLREQFDEEPLRLAQLRRDLDELESTIRDFSDMAKIDKARLFFARMTLEERQKTESEYGQLFATQYVGIMYAFPYWKIPVGSRIVIYGAGKVGQDFYRQIAGSGWCEISAWVDFSWKERQEAGMQVVDPGYLLREDYDYVLIGNANQQIAEAIRDNLQEWGVAPKKILWEQTDIPPFSQARRRIEFAEIIQRIKKRSILLMNTPEHNNLGDHALAIACMNFLQDIFKGRDVAEITGPEWDAYKKAITDAVDESNLICIVGGGFMGDLWKNEDERVKEILRAFPQNKKIVLPQTYYLSNQNEVKGEREFYQNIENLMFIHRDKFSRERFSKMIGSLDDLLYCYPDMALYLEPRAFEAVRDGVLVCFRKDRESIVQREQKEAIYQMLNEMGFTIAETDTVLGRNIGKQERKELLENKWNEFGQAELIITDRLHVMLFAYLVGTPCIVFNNVSEKVEGVARWIEGSGIVKVVGGQEIKLEDIMEMRNCKIRRDDFARKKFLEMGNTIMRWVEG